jgi:hypothetical protein
MEPEVHIIDKYFQEVKRCFTMTNIQLKGKKEIDLLAISPTINQYYHIESRISTTFKLRLKATYTKDGRCHKNGLDYFQKEKFEHPTVRKKIRELIGDIDYHKVLVVWDTQDNFAEMPTIAEQQYGIEIMGLRGMIHEFTHKNITSGSRDDILRVLELVSHIQKEEKAFLTRVNKLGERQRGS